MPHLTIDTSDPGSNSTTLRIVTQPTETSRLTSDSNGAVSTETRGDLPQWLSNAVSNLLGISNHASWVILVEKLVTLDRLLGFPSGRVCDELFYLKNAEIYSGPFCHSVVQAAT